MRYNFVFVLLSNETFRSDEERYGNEAASYGNAGRASTTGTWSQFEAGRFDEGEGGIRQTGHTRADPGLN